MRKLVAFTTLLFFSVLQVQAQGSIKGKIIDSASKAPLSLATVTVFKAADTALITYRISTPDGEFKVNGLPLNSACRVVISYSGYDVFRRVFTLTGNDLLDMGTITMAPSSGTLDEVLVVAERPPVSIRKDTIEFNAASFKTLPTALVEDMLKKLPGVQVDADGNITANGKKVNRIMVDGKEFFGNDPKMATRNLPANVIDKIQLTEDKEERELNPDKAAGEIGQVINLKLKKAIKKGWFGKAYAGGGTDDRYEAGTILNLFRDTMQASLIGFSNNLNRSGFGVNDIQSLGGFGRSGINMMMMNSTGGININGISFGGMGEGINTSTGGGFNMNHVLKNGFTLNSQYFYGQSRNDIAELNNRQQFLTDTVLDTRTRRDEVLKSYNHRVGFGLKGKIDSLTRLEFKPTLSFADRTSDRLTDFRNTNNYDGLLNASLNKQDLTGKDLNYDHNLLIFKNFRKAGRTLNFTNTVNYGRIDNDQVNDVVNTFYVNGTTTANRVNQLRDRGQKNFTTNLNANYNEPLSKATSLRLGYAATYYKNDDLVATFNQDAAGKYTQPNLSLTNELKRTSWRNTASAGINWKRKAFSATATAYLQFLDINNEFYNSPKVKQKYSYLLPGLSINWKELNFSYNGSVSPPNITDLQPTPDNTNPLFIAQGNPNLQPAVTHSMNLHYFKNVPAKTLFVSAYMYANFRNNAITRSRTISPNGVQVSAPINIDGNQDLYNNFNINKQYKFNKNFQVSFGGGYNINYSRNYLVINSLKSYVKTFDIGPSANGSLNWKDLIEWNFRYNIGFNRTTYESKTFNNLKTNRHNGNTELVVRLPKHFVWETSLNYVKNPLTAPGVQNEIYLWNAALTLVFLKDDKGQLKFAAYDLMNNNVSVYRYTNENSIIDRQINILQRYFMATFTYNIRNFKTAKVGGTQRLFMF
ncbi:MAG: hypothetical protein JWP69_2361 [Flaviaesturariibacter sp.]|nr:hypothetical protein [Flaviaesturariibacter sp.]